MGWEAGWGGVGQGGVDGWEGRREVAKAIVWDIP